MTGETDANPDEVLNAKDNRREVPLVTRVSCTVSHLAYPGPVSSSVSAFGAVDPLRLAPGRRTFQNLFGTEEVEPAARHAG